MRRQAVQRLKPLLKLAAQGCEASCTGRWYTRESPTAVPHAPAADSFARAVSDRHASTSGRCLGILALQPSGRGFSSAARGSWAYSSPTLVASAPWGSGLRPLAASALASGLLRDAQPMVPTRMHGARGFASQPIGRITAEGFTEKAWEVSSPQGMTAQYCWISDARIHECMLSQQRMHGLSARPSGRLLICLPEPQSASRDGYL